MFETLESTDCPERAKRFVAFLISVAAHCFAILSLVLLPTVLFHGLPQVDLLTFLLAAPAPPVAPDAPPPPPPKESLAPRRFINIDPNAAPDQIPKGIPTPGPDEMRIIAPDGIPEGLQPGTAGDFQAGVPGALQGRFLSDMMPVVPIPPPPRSAARRKPLSLGGNVLEGRIIRKIDPVYPQLARLARISGTVILQVDVDEEGDVTNVHVLRGHPLLEDAAAQAVRQWKYSPTLLNGEPVPVVGIVTVIFNLR